MKRNELFSLFKFLFIIGIVVQHFAPLGIIAKYPRFCTGSIFVTFFFVFSGFMARISSSQHAHFDSSDFILKRLSRIAPAYYAALAISLVLNAGGIHFVPVLLTLTFMQSWDPSHWSAFNFPAWFISDYVSFLLFFPIAKHWTDRLSPKAILISAATFWLLSQAILILFINSPWVHEALPERTIKYLSFYFPPTHLASFILGIAFGTLYETLSKYQPNKWGSFSFLLLALVLSFNFLQVPWGNLLSLQLPWSGSLSAPIYGLLVLSIAMLHGDLVRPFNNRFLSYLDTIAFPVYMLQFPVYTAWMTYGKKWGVHLSDDLNFFGYLLALIAVACCFQSLFQDKARKIAYLMLSRIRDILRMGYRGRDLQTFCLAWGILAFIGMGIPFSQCLRSLNWINMTFCGLGFIISALTFITKRDERRRSVAGVMGCGIAIAFFVFVSNPLSHLYRYGSHITFGQGGNAEQYQGNKWNYPEAGFTWTEGKSAELLVPISQPKTDIVMSAFLSPFVVPGKLEKQRVGININNQAMGEWVVTTNGEYHLTIPKDYPKGRELMIRFELPDAASPADLGVNSDSRQLALAVQKITLSETGGALR